MRSIEGEVEFARTAKANVLVVGPDGEVTDLLTLLVPDGDPDIMIRCRSGLVRIPPPSARIGVIVFRDVDSLTLEQQRQLSEWLNASPLRRQVISTASTPLLPKVETGQFSDALYYRLNTVYIDLFE
jgi:hypothetical protein